MNPLIIILIVIGIVIFIICSLICITSIVFTKTYGSRADGSISIRYALPSELNNIETKHGYLTSKNNKLFYTIYNKPNSNPKALILMIHGIGSGHFYLIPIIEKLVNDGYMVFAYDQYASGCSEGKIFKTMARGIVDIKYVLKFIDENADLNNLPLYVLGHSWGGYVAGNSLKYSPRISKCVDISGFDNEADFNRRLQFIIMLRNFMLVGSVAFARVKSIFKKTTAKVCYIQGEKDLTVNPKYSGLVYKKIEKINPNLTVKILPNKGHTPFNDDASQLKQYELISEFGTLGNVILPLERYVDFRTISLVDENVYKIILDFLNN